MFLGRNLKTGLIIATIAVLFLPQSASAHAILVESTPIPNGTVVGPTIAVSLRYNSRIDKARSQLTLTLPDKSQRTLPIAGDSPADIVITKTELPPGQYSLRWQVLAIDGHITRGDVPFRVNAPQ